MWVLIVDDQCSSTLYIRHLLRSLNHNAIEQNDPFHALESLKSFTPDVILLDFHMGVMDAPEFLERLHSQYQVPAIPPPVIVMTADLSSESAREVEAAGARSLIHKPVLPANLHAALAQCVVA